jgi:UDP-N-acetylglucosamine 2-epimerase (non-hydrolysing)
VKLGVPVVHVEAGLRSFDRTMPEEVNRLLTDAIADLLLVSEESGVRNLAVEGVPAEKVRLVGNVMIDTLFGEVEAARSLDMPRGLGLAPDGYGLVTLHRPSNVDDPRTLERLLALLRHLSKRLPLVFAVHPRTRTVVEHAGLGGLLEAAPGFSVLPPLSYRENLGLMAGARAVLTDSGGMQEESSVLGVPCLTLRTNTERPITVELGTSRLVGNDSDAITAAFDDAVAGRWPTGGKIPLWDGHAGERVAAAIRELVDA